MDSLTPDHEFALGMLATRGPSPSSDIQRLLGKSQASVSRLIAELGPEVITIGSARATRYALPKSIHGASFQQPLSWTDEAGTTRRVGRLSFLAPGVMDLESDFGSMPPTDRLPWFMSPLRAEGFLGRLLAQRLQPFGLPASPEKWAIEDVLFAALQLGDAPGALHLGDAPPAAHHVLPAEAKALAAALEGLAADVATTLPAGSSAGGEQPKFVAIDADGRHLLVKFAPPRGTPFGERWHDLLTAESLASRVLADHGVPVAATRIVEGPRRTFLLSERFDRIGPRGRRHVVSIGAAHEAFVPGSYHGWGRTAEALARQRRLSTEDAARAAALLDFGHLIGNSDMHSGNLGLFVAAADIARGRFTLAPVFDMLPMRWRPDPMLGGAADYSPFEPLATARGSAAAGPARAFWNELSKLKAVSRPLRDVAREMATSL